MEAPEMALDSCVQSAEIVMPRRKRSRSPAILILDAEEPNNKLLRLRNMDFQLDGKNDCSTTVCSDLLQSPEYRQNGLYAEGGREPIARCKANRAIKKKSKYTVKRKGQRLLRMNFELLKQEMEPIQVVDYLKEKGELFHELHRKTIGKKWRTERVETLLHGLFELMSDGNEDGIFQMIIDALVQSRQTELARELQNDTDNFLPNEIHNSNETGLKDENKRLLQFFTETKDKMRKYLKPQNVVKEIFDLQGLDFEDYDIILHESRRDKCVDILFNALKSRRGKEWQILRPVYNWYRLYSSQWETNDKTETATSSSHESTEVTVSCEPVVTQDSSDHTDPLSQLRELQQSIVQNINGNEGQLNDLDQNIMQDCTSRLQKITFGSINLHLQSMTDESIQKLIDCCKGEEVRKWIFSILGKDDLETLKGLKATTFTVKVFVNDIQRENKYKMFDEMTDGCLCAVNKDSLQNNDAQFKTVIEGLEWKLINSLLEHDILSDELKDILHATRQADELTDFLCHQNIPQVSYCFMENDVLKNDRGVFISQLRQGRPYANDCHRMQHISKSDIKEHKTLLEEETDANWFVSSLQTKGDNTSKDLVKRIKKSTSRRTRTREFVEYLCKVDNEEYKWFEDILQEKHQHLLEKLQPKVLKNVAEVRHGLLSLYDYLIEELDPEDFCYSLKESSLEKLECAQLSLMGNKRDKCKRFLANIMKKENSYLVPEVMHAMMTYKGNIYDTVQLVLAKGSLGQHYRCPWIERENLKSPKCCFKTEISITEDAKEVHHLQTSASTSAETQFKSHDHPPCQASNFSTITVPPKSTIMSSILEPFAYSTDLDSSASSRTFKSEPSAVKSEMKLSDIINQSALSNAPSTIGKFTCERDTSLEQELRRNIPSFADICGCVQRSSPQREALLQDMLVMRRDDLRGMGFSAAENRRPAIQSLSALAEEDEEEKLSKCYEDNKCVQHLQTSASSSAETQSKSHDIPPRQASNFSPRFSNKQLHRSQTSRQTITVRPISTLLPPNSEPLDLSSSANSRIFKMEPSAVKCALTLSGNSSVLSNTLSTIGKVEPMSDTEGAFNPEQELRRCIHGFTVEDVERTPLLIMREKIQGMLSRSRDDISGMQFSPAESRGQVLRSGSALTEEDEEKKLSKCYQDDIFELQEKLPSAEKQRLAMSKELLILNQSFEKQRLAMEKEMLQIAEKQRHLAMEKAFQKLPQSFERQRLAMGKVFQSDPGKEKLENQKTYDGLSSSHLPHLPFFNPLYPSRNTVRSNFSSECQHCGATSYSDIKRKTSIPPLSVNPSQLKDDFDTSPLHHKGKMQTTERRKHTGPIRKQNYFSKPGYGDTD